MCDAWCLETVRDSVKYWPENAKVLEVGGLNVNGCSRGIAEAVGAEYYSVDMQAGKNVDEVVKAENLIVRFMPSSQDVVISTEMLEHAEHWKKAVWNMVGVLKVGGILVLTTRSKGFIRHGYPDDYWRFEVDDLKRIFSPLFEILYLGKDREEGGPGCGIIARKKPGSFEAWKLGLQSIQVHDINTEI